MTRFPQEVTALTEIIADVHPSQTRVVLLKDGEPVEYNVARKGSEPIV